MSCRIPFSITLILAVSIGLAGQTKPPGGGGGGTSGNRPSNTNTGTTSIPRTTEPRFDSDTMPRVFFILGKVVASDGTPLSDRAAIQSNCRGTVKTEAYTDSKGNFSFEFGGNRNQRLAQVGPASDSSSVATFPNDLRKTNVRDLRDCELSAVLSGFTSEVVDLRMKNMDFGNVDVGRIVVRRLGQVQGATINAKIPENARKDYFKGLEEKEKGKMDSAKQKFQKAVAEYPEYAAAWVELGRVQNSQNDAVSARESFHHAITADSTSLPAYQELFQMAARQKQWQEMADTTDQMIKIDPNNYPEFWFYNGVSKYYLNKVDDAENTISQGIKVDAAHRLPKLEYVLGVIKMQKGDRAGAAEHLHKFLELAPTAPEAADAQKKLEVVEKATTGTPAAKP